jgi:hypothetical protein
LLCFILMLSRNCLMAGVMAIITSKGVWTENNRKNPCTDAFLFEIKLYLCSPFKNSY